MKVLKYSEILKLNNKIGDDLKSSSYNISILSNITMHQITEILEYSLRRESINAKVKIGDYDNIIQNTLQHKDSHAVIIFWELSNIIDGLHYKIELFNEKQLNEIIKKTKSEINLVLKNLKNTSLVLVNNFSPLLFSISNIYKSNLEKLSEQLNQYIENNISTNVRLVDLGKVIANVGVEKCIDLRYYYSSKALYTIDFYRAYSEYIKPLIMAVNGKVKKAVIFDCDNTLWKGVVGEDGFDKIEMSPRTKEGGIFSEIQSIALALNRQGILIAICSKNNLNDVEEVIKTHPDMLLRGENITVNKSNWLNKVTNLKQIAEELNIGLESIVFIDDSSFEINLIREQLPEITVLQVPRRLYEYPKLLRSNIGLFHNLSITFEDRNKICMYNQEVKREIIKSEFTDIDDYLSSLRLKMTICQDDKTLVPRISQMTQKTNQFNLTTKRYTEGEVKNLIQNESTNVITFSVSDKFGDSGVTGLCIIMIYNGTRTAEVDTFLMSCRIIGRNLEYVFLNHIIRYLNKNMIKLIKCSYVKSQKNEQVKDFYKKCAFQVIKTTDTKTLYSIKVDSYKPFELNYIKVVYG